LAAPAACSERTPGSSSLTFVLLFIVFDLAFLVSPYWKLAHAPRMQLVSLCLTIILGVVWAWLSSQRIAPCPVRWEPRVLAIAAFIALALNIRALMSALPWKGDEDYHISMVLLQIEYNPFLSRQLWPLLALGLMWSVLLWLARARTDVDVRLVGACCVVAGVQAWFLWASPQATFGISRYPNFVNVIWAFITLPFLWMFDRPPEILMRLPVLLSVTGILWLCMKQAALPGLLPRMLFGAAIATLPLFHFYSSILYLEMPLVFLMILVLRSDSILTDVPTQLKGSGPWLGLLLMGFIKETALPFLLCVFAVRMWHQVRNVRQRESFFHVLRDEASIAFSLFAPIAFYLFWRHSESVRPYSPQIAHLIDYQLYAIMVTALIEQVGLWLLPALGGVVLLLKNGEDRTGFLSVSIFAAYWVFYLMDLREYVGYSRFNLSFLPLLLLWAQAPFEMLAKKSVAVASAIFVLIALSNNVSSPVHWDGIKQSRWGIYLSDGTEEYYPYREALRWINQHHQKKKVLITGLSYNYWMAYYLVPDVKFRIDYVQPGRRDTDVLREKLRKADREGFSIVLFHVNEPHPPDIQDGEGFSRVRIFHNSERQLVLYVKGIPVGPAAPD
jgi:hypothetical protein